MVYIHVIYVPYMLHIYYIYVCISELLEPRVLTADDALF